MLPQMSYTTILYGKDTSGNNMEMERLHGDVNRIWVDYDEIPDDLVNAAIALEDKRFREHQGVDWKAVPIASAVNLVVPIYEGTPAAPPSPSRWSRTSPMTTTSPLSARPRRSSAP